MQVKREVLAHFPGADLPAGCRAPTTGPDGVFAELGMLTTVDRAAAWARRQSSTQLPSAAPVCASALISVAASRRDPAWCEWEALRVSPRSADLLIVAGLVTIKMAPLVRRLYDQMREPRQVIVMGGCCSANSGSGSYALIGVERLLSADVRTSDCPSCLEAVARNILRLRHREGLDRRLNLERSARDLPVDGGSAGAQAF